MVPDVAVVIDPVPRRGGRVVGAVGGNGRIGREFFDDGVAGAARAAVQLAVRLGEVAQLEQFVAGVCGTELDGAQVVVGAYDVAQ